MKKFCPQAYCTQPLDVIKTSAVYTDTCFSQPKWIVSKITLLLYSPNPCCEESDKIRTQQATVTYYRELRRVPYFSNPVSEPGLFVGTEKRVLGRFSTFMVRHGTLSGIIIMIIIMILWMYRKCGRTSRSIFIGAYIHQNKLNNI